MLDDFLGISAVVFDMDGVLFLSNSCHEKAFKETLEAVGIANFSYPTIAGMRTDDAFKKVLSDAGHNLGQYDLLRLVKEKRRRALQALNREGRVAPYSNELITKLSTRYRLALASSASSETVKLFLRKCDYPDVFELSLDGSTVVKAKPAPDIYRLAHRRLNLNPKQCLVIEDSISGVEAAVAAGIRVIAIGEHADSQKLLNAGATKVVLRLQEIEPYLIESS